MNTQDASSAATRPSRILTAHVPSFSSACDAINSFFHGGGIRRRLLIWGLGLFGIALLIVVTASYFYMAQQIRRDAAALQFELASVNSEQIHRFVRRKIERFSDNSAALTLYSLGSKEQQLLLGLLVKNDSSFSEASILNSDGMEVVKVSDRRVYFASDLTDQSKSAKFIKASKGEDYISPVYSSRRAQPYVTLAIPLWGTAQSVAGVVAAEADLSFLWEELAKIRFGSSGYAYLVDAEGKLIAHKDASLVLKRLDLREVDGVKKFLRDPKRADATPASEGRGLAGEPVLVTYAPVRELGWAVILEEPVGAALASVEVLKRSALAFLLVGLIIGAAIIAWVSQKITSPIQELGRDVAKIGAGNLEHRTHITTGDEIEELAGEFNRMTAALQNSHATLEQKVAQRTQEISALYGVTTAVNESLELKDILDAVIPKLTDIFQFETIRMFLLNDQQDELELRASYAVNPDHETSVRTLKRGRGVVGRVVETGEPMIFENTKTDQRYLALSSTRATLRAELGFLAVFPIRTKSRVFGVVLFGARAPRKLSDDEARLLASMAEQLAVAVEKAKLFHEAETHAQQLSVLNTIAAAVSQSLDLTVVLNAALSKLMEVLRFDASWIYMRDLADDRLHLSAHRGLEEKDVSALARGDNLSIGVSEQIFASGQRSVIERDRADQESERTAFASSAGFPIKTKDKVIGVLHLASKEARRFAPDEMQLIESIAQEIGVAAENARLFEQVNEKTAALGKMNQELEEANRAKAEFIAAMSHELRTPLNVIMGNAELTAEGFFGEINADQKKAMTQVRHHSQFLLKLVNDVLALSRLDAKKMGLEPVVVSIDELVSHVQSQVEQLSRNKKLDVKWHVEPAIPDMFTDSMKLEEILQNLIGNAFKFTPHGSIDIRIRNVRALDRIEFSVADTGIGIEPQDMDRIFSAFEQIREAHTGDFNGVGLGLNIVKKYLDLMGGEIRVQSVPGQGTTFTFSLPRSVPLTSELTSANDAAA
jgi:signal transduction histidine kinase